MSSATVRVGVLVERQDSKYTPFHHSMFYCRQMQPGDGRRVPLADWANEEVSFFGIRNILKPSSMKVGETRRYWVHMTMSSHRDYWGEYDSDVEIHSIKRAK
jgi:hypothetical protein